MEVPGQIGRPTCGVINVGNPLGILAIVAHCPLGAQDWWAAWHNAGIAGYRNNLNT